MTLPLAACLSAIFALLALALHALTPAGALAAVAVGTSVLGGLGWGGLAMLGTFFVGASAISRIAPDISARFDAKGTRRDPAQVLANGGAAALGAWHPDAAAWIVAAALGAAAADTWATSVGAWSRHRPRHIVTWSPVDPGTSGGVTWLGSLGGLVGAATVGIASGLVTGLGVTFPLALAVGMLGMLFDSLLGATVQGRFFCDACGVATERRHHRCGRAARHTGGTRWITNDVVNAMATGAAAILGWMAWWLAGPRALAP